ncbi:hypothetical protein LINPERHAP2_LOCUS34746 [Linum perenne]
MEVRSESKLVFGLQSSVSINHFSNPEFRTRSKLRRNCPTPSLVTTTSTPRTLERRNPRLEKKEEEENRKLRLESSAAASISKIRSCSQCGKVLTFENFSTEATFVKNSAGQSQLAGRLVRSIEDENFSRDRLYDRAAREDLVMMKKDDCLAMEENTALVDQAMTSLHITMEEKT